MMSKSRIFIFLKYLHYIDCVDVLKKYLRISLSIPINIITNITEKI